jgi:breast cancer 2 susceptibility protein
LQLDTSRKDPSEVLEAYDNTIILLSANGTQLAPWYAKLGFQQGAIPRTLYSLSGDGGLIPVMNVVVEKTFPVGYLEFIEDEDGNKRKEGPRVEKDEMEQKDKWAARWEKERSKLWLTREKRWDKLEDYAERLEQRSGQFRPNEDGEILAIIFYICRFN